MSWHFVKVPSRLPNEGLDRTIEMTSTTTKVMRFILAALAGIAGLFYSEESSPARFMSHSLRQSAPSSDFPVRCRIATECPAYLSDPSAVTRICSLEQEKRYAQIHDHRSPGSRNRFSGV